MPDTQLDSAIGRRITLPGQFADPVAIESLDDWGDVVTLNVRTARGELKEAQIERPALLALLAEGVPATQDYVDSGKVTLLVESARIRLAYAWDPYFAVSMSGIEALPHQLEAVYEKMLPQARLRFLLADDPGAGKTIMAGLLFKELRLRGAVERALIVAPAPLALQWQDELKSKFDETFELIDAHTARGQLGGSPWARFQLCVTSMDFAKRPEIADELLRERWDLVIIDEAHKVSTPNEEKATLRYKLARALVERTERLLLLTATPHQGDARQFQNLLGLLDEHAFHSKDAVNRLLKDPASPWILRRMKEDMRSFAGEKLFVKRHAYTEEFTLSAGEWDLYDAVTSYINTFLGQTVGRGQQAVALARTVLQRRLASSTRAIRVSIERRHDRLSKLHDELAALPPRERDQRLRQLANLPLDDEQDESDETDDELDALATSATLSDRFERLGAEVDALSQLVVQARELEAPGHKESKLEKLRSVLDSSSLQELREEGGKLVIFTEQRDTLEHLKQHLALWGYTLTEIHGGMDPVERKEAQADFQQNKQILLATDAAGEGINLQFCHLLINYDMPWNPMRLEQRMGRIHRFGQTREVHIFNFVAVEGPQGQPVVEGRVLSRLLGKLDEIRKTLGDRVYDVIGLLLRVSKVNLEEVLRDATLNPRRIEEYVDEIEQISQQRLDEYEKATGIALAVRSLDLSRLRGKDFASEERRLMPEYVEDFFRLAAEATSLRVAPRANPKLLRIEHVPQKFLARTLHSVRQRGVAVASYKKASFHKRELMKPENVDGVLLSPGHPLYAAVDEVLNIDLKGLRGGFARFLDPLTDQPCRIHFFEVELEGESLGDPGEPPQARAIYARLVAVRETPTGVCEEVPPDVLHDLTQVGPDSAFPDAHGLDTPLSAEQARRIEGWVRARVQFPLIKKHQDERGREVEIRKSYLESAFKASAHEAQRKYVALQARVAGGEAEAKFARDEAQRRKDELAQLQEHRLRGLEHLRIVRGGRLARLVSVLVAPPESSACGWMQRDEEVEAFAMDMVKRYEEAQGWTWEDISKANDGSGFDIRSTSPPDAKGVRTVRRIEVKGRAGHEREVMLTPNEWRQAQRLGDTYWLYVVWGCKSEAPLLKTIRNPWDRLRNVAKEIIEVKGYQIPGDALVAAPGEEWRG